MVVASGVTSVRTEIALVTLPLEGHAEIVALRVHRESKVFDLPVFKYEDVETTKAGMTIR